MTSTTPLVLVEGVSRVFGEGRTRVRALDQVSFEVAPGELVVVMGPSGSGKTTLLTIVGGLLRPTSGRVVLDASSSPR